MRSYEDISKRIMERGDKLIEERKVRAARIKHTSYAVSGVCAAAIAGIGVWHIASDIKKPDDGFRDPGIVSVTDITEDTAAETTVTSDEAVAVVTTVSQTVTTVKVTSVTTSEERKETAAASAVSVTAPPKQTSAAAKTTSSVQTTAKPVSSETASENKTTMTDIPVSAASTTTVAASPVTTSAHPSNTSTEEHVNTGKVNENGNETAATTTSVQMHGSHGEEMGGGVAAPPTFQSTFGVYPTYAVLGNTRYEIQEQMSGNDVGDYISRITVTVRVSYGSEFTEILKAYRAADADKEEAVAVRLNDTDEYYLFRNTAYKKENDISAEP